MHKKIIQNLSQSLLSNPKIEDRLKEFVSIKKEDTKKYFCELCFCILTANSKAKSALAIEEELAPFGFIEKEEEELRKIIRKHGHRFHNNKAKFIVLAREHVDIKEKIKNLTSKEAREFIVKNIKGIGYKEASHFLRNVGYDDVAIIDRHILRFMHQNELIKEIPKTITPKRYLEFEAILAKFPIPQNKLDLIIWEKMTGEVLK